MLHHPASLRKRERHCDHIKSGNLGIECRSGQNPTSSLKPPFIERAAKSDSEPLADIAISCCTCTQLGNRCSGILVSAATRRGDRPFGDRAATFERLIHRMRGFCGHNCCWRRCCWRRKSSLPQCESFDSAPPQIRSLGPRESTNRDCSFATAQLGRRDADRPAGLISIAELHHRHKDHRCRAPKGHLVMRVLRALVAKPVTEPVADNEKTSPGCSEH